MPDNDSDFDADLNAILNGGEPQATPDALPGAPTQSDEVAKLKFGGREWDTPEKLGKAYEALHKDYTRKSQEFAKLKPYGDFEAYLSKHPELRQEFNKTWNDKLTEYQKRVNAGQSQATAEKATGLTPDVVERIERIEAHFEDQRLEQEKNQVTSKYNLNNDEIRLVIHKAIELEEKGVRNLSLDEVYKMMSFEQRQLNAKKEGEKNAIDRINQKKKASVGGSDTSSMAPRAKGVSEMNSTEYDKAVADRLEGLGFSG